MARFFLAPIVLLTLGKRAAWSAQARKDNGIEVKEPRKGDAVPSPEERHKYIHDGKEYDRAPNLFDVGDGSLKLLPEVLSRLNFEIRDFKDDGTVAEQKELRDSRPWGRLYIDGWPAPIQYLRSHFGGPPAEGMRPIVLADPLDACGPLQTDESTESALLIAMRGSCTYSTKARRAQEALASALLIVNNEEGVLHPPGPDGMDLDIFSAMIPEAEGTALIQTAGGNDRSMQGALVPMNCNKNSGIGDDNQQCYAAVKVDRDLVDGLSLGGFVRLPSGEKFEYLLAEFGVKIPPQELTLRKSQGSSSSTACDPPSRDDAPDTVDKAILAARGECNFLEKAESMLAGFPNGTIGALIVANTETSLFRMGASPRWRGAKVPFPMVLVSDVAGRALSDLPPGSKISFTPSKKVTVAAWDEIKRLDEKSAWPEDDEERKLLYEALLSDSEGFPDRLSAVRTAFLRISEGSGEKRVAGTVEGVRNGDKMPDVDRSTSSERS